MSTVKLTHNYELTFEKRPGYLYACIKAPTLDRNLSLEYFAEIALKCADLRVKRLLIERDIPFILDEANINDIFMQYVRMSQGMTIAFVNRHDSVANPLEKVVDLVNARGASLSVFSNVEHAEEWLLGHLDET